MLSSLIPSFQDELEKISAKISDDEAESIRKKHQLMGGALIVGGLGSAYALPNNRALNLLSLLAGGLGGSQLTIASLLSNKQIKKMHSEVRDPRLYRNLRNIFKSQEERIADHKNIPKGDGTISGAISSGFFKRGSDKKNLSKEEALSLKRKWALIHGIGALAGYGVYAAAHKTPWYIKGLPLTAGALNTGLAAGSLILPEKAIQDEYRHSGDARLLPSISKFMENREKYLGGVIKENPENFAMLKKKK